VFRPPLGPTQSSIQREKGVLSQRLKRPGSEAKHLVPSGIEVKNDRSISPLPNTSSCCGAQVF
jgi:hypothetical protein